MANDLTAPGTGLVQELKTMYEDYIRGSEEFHAQQKRPLLSLFSGKGRYGGCPLDEKFLHELEVFSEEASQSADAESAAALTEYMLLGEHVHDQHPAYWITVAAEGLALPLIPLLAPGALEALYERYRKKLRRHGALPRQKDVLGAMKQRL